MLGGVLPSLKTLVYRKHTSMEWRPRPKDIKSYFHFDRPMSVSELSHYAQNDEVVAKHRFFPLILFHEKFTKFRKGGAKKVKSRPLRYAARRDAAIYAFHRWKLSRAYERELARRGIGDVPIAYRKISNGGGSAGKCNIDFAKEAFDFIKESGDADVTVVDISSYFESLDHSLILQKWEGLIGSSLNIAEKKVFQSLTEYCVVDRRKVFERLGLYEKGIGQNRIEKRQRKLDKFRAKKLRQVCSPAEFRNKICGQDPNFSSLLQKNSNPHGIPQGTPISDLIANIYLIDFDQKLARWVKKRGGKAFRYSDDIIVILPRVEGQAFDLAQNYLMESIKCHGHKLEIQPKKVAIGRFLRTPDDRQIYTHLTGNASKNGLEYLGFEFNGLRVKIKDATLSNAWRKLKKRTYGWARRYVRHYRAKGDVWLRQNGPLAFEAEKIIKIVGINERDFKKWTFNRYVKRANEAFADYDTTFDRQTKKYRKSAVKIVMQESFDKAISKHGEEACLRKGIQL